MNFLEIYWTDVYKAGHRSMLPAGSILMSSNLTPRSGKWSNSPDSKGVISIGQQMTVRKLKEDWDNNFFKRPISEIDQFGKDITDMLMLKEPFNVSHFKELHQLGYLPIEIKSITEGEFIPYKVPMFTIVNTIPLNGCVFDWIVNYLETILSSESWAAPTSASLALAFKRAGKQAIMKTDPENIWFLDYKYHDFSMRGMNGKSAIMNSSLGFASVSRGSDTLPLIPLARKYYDETEVCINSVIASEHAIMCTLTGFYLKNNDGKWSNVGDFEYETFVYLLKKFPSGVLSLVMDTWDIWRAIQVYCKNAKDLILSRDGKLVIRPDSGGPADIICGLNHQFGYSGSESIAENKGVVELLWDIFGGEITSTGYKRLNSHIGAIYGDSITLIRSIDIDNRLIEKGFATTNVVLGVGSYSLQCVSRDVHGFAQKATYVEIEIEKQKVGIEIFKDPITSDGVKKSAKGLIVVYRDENGVLYHKDQATWDEVNSDNNELKTIFKNGVFYNQTTLTEIRKRINNLL